MNSYTNPVSLRIPASQFILSGEQNCPSAVQERATGDTVKIAGPGPAHGVANADVDGIRHKTEFVFQRSNCHIKNLAPNVSFSTESLTSVLIDDAD